MCVIAAHVKTLLLWEIGWFLKLGTGPGQVRSSGHPDHNEWCKTNLWLDYGLCLMYICEESDCMHNLWTLNNVWILLLSVNEILIWGNLSCDIKQHSFHVSKCIVSVIRGAVLSPAKRQILSLERVTDRYNMFTKTVSRNYFHLCSDCEEIIKP